MGRALAALLEREVQNPGDELRPLLDVATTALPEEMAVRRLLESAGLDAGNAEAAVAAARSDGDVFDGDELGTGQEVQFAHGGRIVEAVGQGDKPGTTRYKVAVIRPGRAQGYGRRYYSKRMLEANAANFGGQPVFWNHEDIDTILKRGHGSRDPRDLCGWLQEGTWWDPEYTETDDKANGRLKGAVMGHTDVNSGADELLSTFPQALALSANMDSTKIRVGKTDEGALAPIVEGVVKHSGSIDLITGKAGAGGKVLERLRESASLPYHPGNEDLADVPSDRLLEAARSRPELAEHFREADPNTPPEGSMSAIDPGKLVEALGDEAVQGRILEALAGSPALDRIIEAKVAEREDEIRADARADSDRALDLRDLRDEAKRLIEAKAVGQVGGLLTPAFVDDLVGRYALRDGHPTPALDVYPELDAAGAVVKSARDRLVESVEADIAREEAKIREAAPTRVRGLRGGDDPERIVEAPENESEADKTARLAREAEAAKIRDPLADELGIDPERVHRYQTNGV